MVTTEAETSTGSQQPGPAKSGTAWLLLVLGSLTAVAPLAIDMYVPAFPVIASALDAPTTSVQLTMTAFLIGLVIGQLAIGPISDSLGRRGLLLGGTAGFIVFSAACIVAPNVGVLIAARFLQGASAAAGMVLARAVITDRFSGRDIPRYFAVLSQILGVAPVAAPVLGGVILSLSSWRTVFIALAVVGVALLIGVLTKVPESLPKHRRHSGTPTGTFTAMGRLFGNRPFMGNALVLGLGSAAMFAYIGGSSFVFKQIHGVSTGMYSVIFAVNSLAVLVAGGAFGKLANRMRLNTLLIISISIATAGALAQVFSTAVFGENLAVSWITLFIIMFGLGMLVPATLSLGQNIAGHAPGAASALLGGLQFTFGALSAPLVGMFGTHSSMPMALTMLIALAAAITALLTLVRPQHHHGEVTTP